MKRRGLLVGAYWFTMYTTFFAILSIVYFVLENPNNPTSTELLRDAMEGKEVLAQYAKRSMAADRCSATLNTIFEKLPEQVKRGGGEVGTSKKRRQGSSPQSMHARPTVPKQDSDFIAVGPKRASTFPESIPNRKSIAPGHSLPLSQAHLANLGLDQQHYQPSPTLSNTDLFDPAPSLTPTSTTTSNMGFSLPSQTPQQRPAQSFPATPLTNTFIDPAGVGVPVSDVSAMMFPSGDPLAYPNQPMTTFENNNAQNFSMKIESSPNLSNFAFPPNTQGIDMKANPAMYSQAGMQNPNAQMQRIDNDVQLFGPMPMYLMQGAQFAQNQAQLQARVNAQSMPMTNADGTSMHFDDIFGGEEWANTFMDQGLGFNNASGGSGPNVGSNLRNWST